MKRRAGIAVRRCFKGVAALKRLATIVEIICVVLLVEIVLVVSLQVVLRYVFADPLVWVEEWTRYSLVWLTFFGSFLALHRNKHIKMEIVYGLLPARIRRVLDIAGHLAIAVFSVYMAGFGWSFSFKLMNTRPESFPIPMGIFYLIIPVGGLLFLANSICEIYQLFIKPAAMSTIAAPEERREVL